jgi:hypothetical protein
MAGLAKDCLVPGTSSARDQGDDSLSVPSDSRNRESLTTSPGRYATAGDTNVTTHRFNGTSLTHGEGLINGSGMTECFRSSREETRQALYYRGKGLDNGDSQDDQDGLRHTKSLSNGLATGVKVKISLPKRGIRRRTRKRRSMMKALTEKSEDPIDDLIERIVCQNESAGQDNEGYGP